MALNNKKIFAFAGTILLSVIGFGTVSAPAHAADCPFPVADQTANDHPKDSIHLISPVLTDENSIHRTDFEGQFTLDCDWFGVGMQFHQVYVPYGLRTTFTFHAATPAGAPLANTQVKLRANKGYSHSNADVRVNGLKARVAQDNSSEGGSALAKTDVNGNVSFVIASPDDCTAYGGTLPTAPESLTSDTPNDVTGHPTEDCYSQFLPEITGEKTDAADFVEIHYYDAVAYATTGALGTDGNLLGGDITTTYTNKAAGIGATLKIASSANWTSTSIDGVSVKVNDIVLVKNQAAALQNGIYTVTSVGAVGNKTDFVLTRDKSNDEPVELDGTHPAYKDPVTQANVAAVPGESTVVISGAVNQGQTWGVTTIFGDNDTVGAVSIDWAKTSSADVPDSVATSVLTPLLNDSNSISGGGVTQSYALVGSKMVVAVQAIGSNGTWARNLPVNVRINLANSGANALISAGIVGNTASGGATTLSNADATKTADDQLVLSGTTDAFGIVTFELDNSDTEGEARPATPTSPVPVVGAKFTKLIAEVGGITNTGNAVELHYYKQSLPITVSASASGKKVSVTIKNAIGKRFTVTITGLKKLTVTPTKATQVFTYTVTKGVKTVTVSADGRTLTKKFTIK